jgi:hypothetical protein
MQHDAFDHVVGRVSEGDDIGTHLGAGSLQKLVSERPGGGLDGALRQGRGPSLGDERDAQRAAKRCDMLGRGLRPLLQRVVEMRSNDIEAGLLGSGK